MISIEVLTRERVLLYSLFVLLAFFQVISDPDYFFHLTAGAYIVDHRLLPEQDVFSYTMNGAPWVMHEWLFEVFIYGLHHLGGDMGVSLFFAALIVLFLKLSISAIPTDNVNAKIVVTLLTLVLLSPYLAPRPQVFSFLFFSFSLFALFRWYTENTVRYLKWLPLQMLPWVNIHGGYLIGIVLIIIFIGLETVRARQQHSISERIKPLLLTLLLTTAVSLVNPYFIHLWLFPFELMGMPYVQQISEWRAPDITLLRIQVYIIYLVIYLSLTIYLLRQCKNLAAVLPLPFIIASLDSERHIPFALLSMAPLFLLQLSQLKQRASHHALSLPHFTHRPFFSGKPLGKLENRLNGVLAFIITLIAIVFYTSFHANDRYRRNQIVPVMATDFIRQKGIDGRMFNSYRYGGYLLYRLYPKQRVFIDARADMYDSKIHADYERIFFARPGWDSLIKHYGIDYFVFDRNTPIAKVLSKDKDFSIVYRDSHSIIALRRIPRFADIISRYGH